MLSLFVKKNPTDNTKLGTKIIRKTQSTANQFDAETLTQALQTKVERNAQTVRNNMLTLFVKEIPTDITKLETKNIRKTRSTASQFDAETLTQALQTKVERHAQSATKWYHCSSKRFLRTSQNWKQKSSNTRSTKINFMQAQWITYLDKWNQMHAKSAKTLSLLARDSYVHHETGTKNHNRGLNLRLSNLMLGHWLKRCHLMCNEMHGHSAAK